MRKPFKIIIFTRYPVPGKTKTRLIPMLGPVGAAELHREFSEKTFDTVMRFSSDKNIEVELSFTGGSRHRLRKWIGSNILLSRQEKGDLGERMKASFVKAFNEGYKKVILIGTDIPEMRGDHLMQAFEALNNNDTVFGPSTDGGYWLIGLKRPVDLFQGINWGKSSVLNRTLELVREKGLSSYIQEPLTDIDEIEDLKRWRSDGSWQKSYVSVIIPALNEEANINRTIDSARDQDAEIIVVDGRSNDRTVSRAMDAGARVIQSSPGRALQQNNGAGASSGKVLLFAHADTILPEGYVGHIFETLMDSRVVAGAFRFRTDLNHPFMKLIEEVANIRARFLQLPYGDQAIFLRRSTFESAGGFALVPIAEDLFFIRDLKKTGKIRISPAPAVTSARRWRELGLIRTTWINYKIMAGCLFGVPPEKLVGLYRRR